ncbi:MAG: hypothetical protein DI580_13140 [Cutibacterium acnes]|nr:MAG: hypothetical protein DI580_13140 [Cutibacterium acnes]
MHSHFTQPHRRKPRITVTSVKTINVKPISEDQVDAWVAEAENGNDIEFLRSRGCDPRDSKRSTTPEG